MDLSSKAAIPKAAVAALAPHLSSASVVCMGFPFQKDPSCGWRGRSSMTGFFLSCYSDPLQQKCYHFAFLLTERTTLKPRRKLGDCSAGAVLVRT